MDHYSKMILGWEVSTKSSPKIIKSLLQNAFEKLENQETIEFLTDGGIENVNKTVRNYVLSTGQKITHNIAQKDRPESNSTIEAFNKVLKNQFIRPQNPENGKQLIKALNLAVENYNYIRPQHYLKGNTPEETYNGKPLAFSQYNTHFTQHKTLRKTQNHLNRCKKCLN